MTSPYMHFYFYIHMGILEDCISLMHPYAPIPSASGFRTWVLGA